MGERGASNAQHMPDLFLTSGRNDLFVLHCQHGPLDYTLSFIALRGSQEEAPHRFCAAKASQFALEGKRRAVLASHSATTSAVAWNATMGEAGGFVARLSFQRLHRNCTASLQRAEFKPWKSMSSGPGWPSRCTTWCEKHAGLLMYTHPGGRQIS